MNDLVSSAQYHHGIVIKAFREAANMTQPRLAELWPKEGGVSVRYVQDVESGKKHIGKLAQCSDKSGPIIGNLAQCSDRRRWSASK